MEEKPSVKNGKRFLIQAFLLAFTISAMLAASFFGTSEGVVVGLGTAVGIEVKDLFNPDD